MSDFDAVDETADTSRTINFEFRGDGFEYFKIWIVNVLLTILTLGIYSAWAKVRSNRYFYSNLYLDDSNFRYLADPLTILKGRVIAVVVLVIYSGVSSLYPAAGVVLAIILLLAIPYLVNQSLAFNHRMSSYKNIQFRFDGSYGEAFVVMYLWPIAGILTLGILYPMAILKANRYVVENSSFGTSYFDFSATFKDYGLIFLVVLGIFVLFGAILGVLSAVSKELGQAASFLMLFVYFGAFVYVTVEITNLYYRCVSLIDHEFEAHLTMSGFAGVLITNVFFTVITLGLFLPAAKVRMTRYICSNLQMHAYGSLDGFAAAEREYISALGEEFGQVFDFGI